MKISLLSLVGGVLLLLASTVVAAAPLPPAFLSTLGGDVGSQLPAFLLTPAVPAASSADPCGLPRYSCQPCSIASTPVKLCSETICGNYVIVHCDACAPTCHLPPG